MLILMLVLIICLYAYMYINMCTDKKSQQLIQIFTEMLSRMAPTRLAIDYYEGISFVEIMKGFLSWRRTPRPENILRFIPSHFQPIWVILDRL